LETNDYHLLNLFEAQSDTVPFIILFPLIWKVKTSFKEYLCAKITAVHILGKDPGQDLDPDLKFLIFILRFKKLDW